jgi:hypothetical protein
MLRIHLKEIDVIHFIFTHQDRQALSTCDPTVPPPHPYAQLSVIRIFHNYDGYAIITFRIGLQKSPNRGEQNYFLVLCKRKHRL